MIIHHLSRGHDDILSLSLRSGMVVYCLNGIVWLTQTGDPLDYLLKAGDLFEIRKQGMIVLQSLQSEAEVKIIHHL